MMIVHFFVLFQFPVARIRFGKYFGDFSSSAPLARSRIHKYGASLAAGASELNLPYFSESASGGNRIRSTLTSGFAQSCAGSDRFAWRARHGRGKRNVYHAFRVAPPTKRLKELPADHGIQEALYPQKTPNAIKTTGNIQMTVDRRLWAVAFFITWEVLSASAWQAQRGLGRPDSLRAGLKRERVSVA